jgi:hypothetical protein
VVLLVGGTIGYFVVGMFMPLIEIIARFPL